MPAISDTAWSQIVGEQKKQIYEVNSGDTLYGISSRFFGDPNYWPKLWAVNNGAIKNAHLILPGQKISFFSGSDTQLPGIQLADSSTRSAGARPARSIPKRPRIRSQQWMKLPMGQVWEIPIQKQTPSMEGVHLERPLSIKLANGEGFELPTFLSDSKLEPAGVIEASESKNRYLSKTQKLYITSESELKVGDVFTVTSEPEDISWDDVDAYAYKSMGTVKIVDQIEDKYVGEILSNQEPIEREQFLIPQQKMAKLLTPAPAPEGLVGQIQIDPRLSSSALSQFQTAYINLGSADGVRNGMYFRSFQNFDPETEEDIFEDNHILSAEMQVVQTAERSSVVVITDAVGPVISESIVQGVIDTSTLIRSQRLRRGAADEDLDRLDDGQDGTADELRTLKQLENHVDEPPVDDSDLELLDDEGPESPTDEELDEDVSEPDDALDEGETMDSSEELEDVDDEDFDADFEDEGDVEESDDAELDGTTDDFESDDDFDSEESFDD